MMMMNIFDAPIFSFMCTKFYITKQNTVHQTNLLALYPSIGQAICNGAMLEETQLVVEKVVAAAAAERQFVGSSAVMYLKNECRKRCDTSKYHRETGLLHIAIALCSASSRGTTAIIERKGE